MIITSDHGMETIKGKENAIFLDNYVNTSLFEAYGSSAVYDLFLKNGEFVFFLKNFIRNLENDWF